MTKTTLVFLFSPLAIFMVFTIYLFNVLGLIFLDIDLAWHRYPPLLVPFMALGLMALILHRPVLARLLPAHRLERLQGTDRLRDMLLAFIALFFVFLGLQPLVHIVYALSPERPYVDEMLHGWDLALGLNWQGYFDWVHQHPVVIRTLEIAYDSMTYMTIVALAILMVMGRDDRAFVLVHAFLATALVCVAFGQFYPALGATALLIPDMAAYPNYPYAPGTYAVAAIEGLRSTQGTVLLDPLNLPGLITFPSFHTAGSVVIAYAFLRTRLAVLAVIYGGLVIASAPIFGAHYLIDVAVGAVLGVAISWVVEAWLFARNAALAKAAA